MRVVSVTAPSIAYQYQYAAQEPAHLEYFSIFFQRHPSGRRAGGRPGGGDPGWGY